MILIPAVDIKGRCCVRLKGGNFSGAFIKSDPVVEINNLLKLGVKKIHLIDLEGSLGKPNLSVVKSICTRFASKVDFQLGGGIRSLKTIESYLTAGISTLVLGTLAISFPQFLLEACFEFPGRIALGLDTNCKMVSINAWKIQLSLKDLRCLEILRDLGLDHLIYTNIKSDGKLRGLDLNESLLITKNIPIPLIISGGLSAPEEFRLLLNKTMILFEAIAGSALFKGLVNCKSTMQYAKSY